jgi:superfamily II DNA/RNA helicase
MDQSSRTAALDQFRKNEVTLLVASDVAARGLDIPAVSHIFNFDVPHHADDYVHRIGRTGRAGRSGTAITVVTPAEQKSVVAIEKLIGQSIPWMEQPPRETSPARETSEERSSSGEHRNGRTRRPRPETKSERKPSRREPAATVTRLDEARSRRAPKAAAHVKPPVHAKPAVHDGHGHLPAFLLRPVRIKA